MKRTHYRSILKLFIIYSLLSISAITYSRSFTLSGYVIDSQTGERLIGATIFDAINSNGSTSNKYGFYSLTVPEGSAELTISYIGYENFELQITLHSDTIINFELQPSSIELAEFIIRSSSNEVYQTQMSLLDLSVKKLESIPIIMGETDLLKILQLYPGVQSGMEGTSGIYVRGGSSDQNLFLIDDVPVYNPNHLLGLFSTFNSSSLKSVKLYKGGFPARYGGRLSSVADITMKEGNMKKFTGDFSIGLLSSKFLLEGPIRKDTTSFMISGRRSYIDLLANPVLALRSRNETTSSKLKLYFYDINAKINHLFSNRSRVYLSLYCGRDKFGSKDSYYHEGDNIADELESTMGWQNSTASLRWNYVISNKLFSNTTISYSSFGYDFSNSEKVTFLDENLSQGNSSSYISGIEDLSAKVEFNYFSSDSHQMKFGLNQTYHMYNSGVLLLDDGKTNDVDEEVHSNEFSAYFEDEVSIGKRIALNLGIHLSIFQVNETSYVNPQPRLSLNYKALKNQSFKASYARMAQHVHLLSSSMLSLPTDLWVPVTENFGPPQADQLAFGTVRNISKGFKVSIEGFYKKMSGLIEFKEGTTYLGDGSSWEDNVEQGIGWSYGAELLFEKTVGNTKGWIGYTWSKSERLFENINFGQIFPYKYDRRHDISVVVTHQFNENVDISTNWVYGSGNTATIAFTQYPLIGIPGYTPSNPYSALNYGSRNGYRLPSYHRLDLGINLHKQKKHGVRTWSFSIYNAYNRQNASMITWRNDNENAYKDENGFWVSPKKPYILSLFPIIPSVSYSFKFK